MENHKMEFLTKDEINLIKAALEILQGNLERAGGSFAKKAVEIQALLAKFK